MNPIDPSSHSRRDRALDVVEAMILPALREIQPGTTDSFTVGLDERLLLEVDALDGDERGDVIRELVMLTMLQATHLAGFLSVHVPDEAPTAATVAAANIALVRNLRRPEDSWRRPRP